MSGVQNRTEDVIQSIRIDNGVLGFLSEQLRTPLSFLEGLVGNVTNELGREVQQAVGYVGLCGLLDVSCAATTMVVLVHTCIAHSHTHTCTRSFNTHMTHSLSSTLSHTLTDTYTLYTVVLQTSQWGQSTCSHWLNVLTNPCKMYVECVRVCVHVCMIVCV